MDAKGANPDFTPKADTSVFALNPQAILSLPNRVFTSQEGQNCSWNPYRREIERKQRDEEGVMWRRLRPKEE